MTLARRSARTEISPSQHYGRSLLDADEQNSRNQMDKDTKLAIVSLLEVSQNILKNTSETRILALRSHEALVKAQVPGYLEAYDSYDARQYPELTAIRDKLSEVVELEVEGLRRRISDVWRSLTLSQ